MAIPKIPSTLRFEGTICSRSALVFLPVGVISIFSRDAPDPLIGQPLLPKTELFILPRLIFSVLAPESLFSLAAFLLLAELAILHIAFGHGLFQISIILITAIACIGGHSPEEIPETFFHGVQVRDRAARIVTARLEGRRIVILGVLAEREKESVAKFLHSISERM